MLGQLSLIAQSKLTPLDHKLQPIENEEEAVYMLESKSSDSALYDVKIFYADMTPLMDGKALDEEGKKLSGNSVWYYKNGQVQSEGAYNDGKKTGTWKRYNEDGSQKSDRVYSDLSMETMVFSSALYMPKPQVDERDLVNYLKKEITREKGFDIISLEQFDIELVISRTGQLQEAKYDDKLSQEQMQRISSLIEVIPHWKPGSNGSQNINVRCRYTVDFTQPDQ